MAKHKIAVIPGDGIGKEVVPEGLRVLDAAARQPQWAAIAGSTSADSPPPRVSPICLMPIAMPRSVTGKRSTMALPSTGLTMLQPEPAKARHSRNTTKCGASAAARSPTPPMASAPSRVGRTPH